VARRHPTPSNAVRPANNSKYVAFCTTSSDGGDGVGYEDDCHWEHWKRQ
uniref:Uncharacterized protein n=1 Tax=Caenorhabditis japonica TaxID=281687 RepID=A0A8R1I649_CAEJA